jgi:hypothetical protein
MRRASPLLVLLAIAACNDDVDLTGIYKVDSDVSSMPCGSDAAIADPPVTLKFAKANFFGAEYFSYQTCDDLAATTCSTGGLLDAGFSEPIDSGWRGVVTSSGSSGGSLCTISYTEQTAVLHGTRLVVESTRYSEQVDNTTTLCAPEEAERRNTSMPCASHERIEATKQ